MLEFFLEGALTTGTAYVELSDFAWHPNGRFAKWAMEKSGGFPLTETNGQAAELAFDLRGKLIVCSIFPLTLHVISGEHTEENCGAQHKLNDVQNKARNKRGENSKKKPDNGQKSVQRVGSVTTDHKTGKCIPQLLNKSHLFLLPPITRDKRRKNCINDTARAAT